MSHIFFKTRLCLKFSQGNCSHGDTCSFAHGVSDLRHPPPNWQQLVRDKEIASGRWIDQRFPPITTKICKKFYNGEECPYGHNCNFLHQRPFPFRAATPETNHFDFPHQTGLHSSRNYDDDEVGLMGNSRFPAKPSLPVVDPFPVAITSHRIDERVNNTNASKWKLNKKINSIYADWIDDVTEY